MSFCRTMATLARNSENEILFVVVVFQRSGTQRLEIRGMTLQAARGDGTVEVRGAIHVAGAVSPGLQTRPVGDGEFEECVFSPIKVRLALGAGSDDKINPLGAVGLVALVPSRRLVKPAVSLFHHEGKLRIE